MGRNNLEFTFKLELTQNRNIGWEFDEVSSSGTSPVVGSWSSKHQVVVVLGEGGSQTLLARAERLVAPGSALTEVPVPSVFIRGRVNGQVLTQDVTATGDVPRLLRGVGKNTLLIEMGARLKGPSATNGEETKPALKDGGNGEERLTTTFPPGP